MIDLCHLEAINLLFPRYWKFTGMIALNQYIFFQKKHIKQLFQKKELNKLTQGFPNNLILF
jgi:hypothetical protein